MNAIQPIKAPQGPETRKFLAWIEGERAKGLQDIRFFPLNTAHSTVETFSGEVHRLLEAPTLPDPDLFR